MSTTTRNFVADHVAGIPRSGIRDFFDIVQRMPEAISLGVGEPDFVTPWHIREAAIYALERGRTQYTANLGLLRLRESIAAYVQQKFGVRYDPQNQILVAVGVSEALDLALRAVLKARSRPSITILTKFGDGRRARSRYSTRSCDIIPFTSKS